MNVAVCNNHESVNGREHEEAIKKHKDQEKRNCTGYPSVFQTLDEQLEFLKKQDSGRHSSDVNSLKPYSVRPYLSACENGNQSPRRLSQSVYIREVFIPPEI